MAQALDHCHRYRDLPKLPLVVGVIGVLGPFPFRDDIHVRPGNNATEKHHKTATVEKEASWLYTYLSIGPEGASLFKHGLCWTQNVLTFIHLLHKFHTNTLLGNFGVGMGAGDIVTVVSYTRNAPEFRVYVTHTHLRIDG